MSVRSRLLPGAGMLNEVCMRGLPCRRHLCTAVVAALLGLIGGCNLLRFRVTPPDRPVKVAEKDAATAEPSKHTVRLSQYAFHSDFELKRDLPLFTELGALRDHVYRELQLPESTSLVQVFIFENRERYERFMRARYPDLPKRRAFFVAQPHTSASAGEDLLVYTYWGERVREDLRHELTHALLHSVLKDVPLWLDEGLAEYFELPPDRGGVNLQHLELALRGSTPLKPNLARLEQLSQVQQMTPGEYREAWAWVHLMLHGKPEAKKVLLAYLQQLRTNPNPGPLQAKLGGVYALLDDALEKHLVQLDTAAPRVVPTASRTP
jgi:hypothetical protein